MSNTLTLVKKSSFYQDVVLKLMSKMDKGNLHITLSDGEQLVLGTGEGKISANMTVQRR